MKKSYIFIVLTVGILLGIVFIIQVKTNKTIDSSVPIEELMAKEELLKTFNNEQAYLQSRILYLREEISESQEKLRDDSENFNLDLLNELKMIAGLTDVYGPGLEIIIDDSRFANRDKNIPNNNEIVQASDLRDISNALNSAHSKAISINEQRVLSSTAINSLGSSILVNNTQINPPFVIKAIGDVDVLVRGLNNRDLLSAIFKRIDELKLEFIVSVHDNIVVKTYNGNIKAKYINLIEQ